MQVLLKLLNQKSRRYETFTRLNVSVFDGSWSQDIFDLVDLFEDPVDVVLNALKKHLSEQLLNLRVHGVGLIEPDYVLTIADSKLDYEPLSMRIVVPQFGNFEGFFTVEKFDFTGKKKFNAEFEIASSLTCTTFSIAEKLYLEEF